MSVKNIVLNQLIPELLNVSDRSEALEVLEYNSDALTELLDDPESLKDSLDTYIYELDSEDEEALEKIIDIYETRDTTEFISFLNKYIPS